MLKGRTAWSWTLYDVWLLEERVVAVGDVMGRSARRRLAALRGREVVVVVLDTPCALRPVVGALHRFVNGRDGGVDRLVFAAGDAAVAARAVWAGRVVQLCVVVQARHARESLRQCTRPTGGAKVDPPKSLPRERRVSLPRSLHRVRRLESAVERAATLATHQPAPSRLSPSALPPVFSSSSSLLPTPSTPPHRPIDCAMTDAAPTAPPPVRFTTALLSGALAGTAVDTLFFPIDTLKTRAQSAQGFFAAGGFRGVYRGLGSAVVGSAPGGASASASASSCSLRSSG